MLVVGSASAATAHHKDGHTANYRGLCTAEANGGNPGGNGKGNGHGATAPDCDRDEEEPDTEAPTFASGSATDQGTVTLSFTESIDCDTVDVTDYEGTLVRSGGTEGPVEVTCDGDTITLQADEGTSGALQGGDEIIITLTDDNDVTDLAGNEQPQDDEFTVVVEGDRDTIAPRFDEATFADGAMTVVYTEDLDCSTVDPSDYEGTLVRGTQELGTEEAATAACDGDTVVITADEGTTGALEPGDELVITPTSTNNVSDAAGNQQPQDDEISATVPA